MKVENIIRAKLRKAQAELAPVLRRKLTPTQIDRINEAFAIQTELFFDHLDDILSNKNTEYDFPDFDGNLIEAFVDDSPS